MIESSKLLNTFRMQKKTHKNLSMSRKRASSRKKIEQKWQDDKSSGKTAFAKYYKPKGASPKINTKPLRGGSPGLGKKK